MRINAASTLSAPTLAAGLEPNFQPPWWMRPAFVQAEDGIRDDLVTGVQTCALPISGMRARRHGAVVNVSSDTGRAPTEIGRGARWEREEILGVPASLKKKQHPS